MLADQADGGFGVVEGNGDDVGQHVVRRALRIGDRDRRVAAPGFRRRIEAHLGIVIGAVIGALAFGDFGAAGMRPRRLQRHHHGFGAGIGKAHLLDRRQPRSQQFREIDLGFRRQAERRAQRQLRGRRLDQRGMGVAVDLRGEIVDAVDVDVAVEIPDPAALAARGVDRIGLHEHGGAGVAAGQARQRAIIHFLRRRVRIRVHACFLEPHRRMRWSAAIPIISQPALMGIASLRPSYVYIRNTIVPMIKAAAMNSSTAGNPKRAATTPVDRLHQRRAEEEREIERR